MSKKFILLLLLLACFWALSPVGRIQAADKEDELFFVAQKAFEDGFYDVALRYLNRFLTDYPQTTKRNEALLLIGQCYFFDNQYLKAFEQFESLLNSPEAREIRDAVLFWLGEVYLKSKDYKQAEKSYLRLINEYPASEYLLQGYYSLGWAYFEDNLYRQAIDAFAVIMERYPDSALAEDAYFKTAECLFNLQNYLDAIAKFNGFIKKYPQSSHLDQSYFYIAEAYYYRENFNSAIKNYNLVIENSQNDRLINLARVGLGWSYLKLKQYKESHDMFNQAQSEAGAKNLEKDDILLGKATLFTAQEDFTRALVIYNEVIDKHPQSRWLFEARLGQANCLHELGRYPEAVSAYEVILDKFSAKKELRAEIEKVYFGLAWSYLKMGKFQEAISYFQKVREFSLDKAIRLSALCQIGDIYQDMGDLPAAIDTYDKILKEYPDSLYNDYIQYREGIALLKMDRIEAATLIFQSLSKNYPKSRFITDAQYYLGMAYFKKGDLLSSREQFQGLLARLPRESEYRSDVMYSLALNLAYLKDYKKAIEMLERIKRDYQQEKELVQKCDFEIALSLFRWGKEPDALKKFKLIVYKYPQTAIALKSLLWLGDYYLETGKPEIARRYLKTCLKEYAQSDKLDEAHYLMGLTYKSEKRYDEALAEFKQILEDEKNGFAVRANLVIAEILAETSRLEEAVQIYNAVVAKYPYASREAFIGLADLYYHRDYYDKAIEAYKAALSLPQTDTSETSNPELQFKLAEAIEGAKDVNKAIETYLKIPYLYPQSQYWVVRSYLRVARLFEDNENWQEAKKIYEKLVQENVEESKFAVEKLEWIRNNVK